MIKAHVADRESSMLGQLLGGRYQVLKTLSGGSFGQTYLAADMHRPDKPQCVVKHLKPAKRDPEFLVKARLLFQREAATLEQLGSYPQIPRLLAYFEEQQEFYLVQEFIPGDVLRMELLPGCHWSEDRVVQLLTEVLHILEFIHSHGVIHRDIKPENLIRRQQDQMLVLIDFGAVKQIQAALDDAAVRHPQMEGTIAIGTPGYIPPEQAQGRPLANSDIYALGMVAIQALTGKNPTQLPHNAQGEVSWQSEVELSPKLRQILFRMVRYHFQNRYQSAREVLQELQQPEVPDGWFQRMGRVLRSPFQDRDAAIVAPAAARPAAISPVQPPPPSLGSEVFPAPPQTIPDAQGSTISRRIFISSLSFDPELELAQRFYDALLAAGHQPFMAAQSIQLGEGWAQRIGQALRICDYFVLLLSPESALSEMVLEELRTLKQFHPTQSQKSPVILPIRVNFDMDQPLNYELRGYLHRLQQRFWRSPQDTPELVRDILAVVQSQSTGTAATGPATPTTGSFPAVTPDNRGLEGPPLPVAEPELPEGQVNLASAFYIERPPIEARCAQTITQPGALIRVKAPRQMGKTSLMARILHHAAAEQEYHTISLSLQLADAKVFADLDQFLRWLCVSVGRRLRLPKRIDEYWDDIFGSKYNCTAYFEEYLLSEIQSPLALGLDEVDRVFEYPEIASDFFGLLRAWHEEAKNRDVWQKLRLIVVHATEVYIPLNTNQSPFNVGLPVELPEFTLAQLEQLAQLHGLHWQDPQLQQLQTMIGGHPYLVRLALYHLSRQDLSLTQLIQDAPTEAGLFRDHLRGHWWNLQQHPHLAEAFNAVVTSDHPVSLEPSTLFKLYSLGLIKLVGNEAQPRCDLYRQYFGEIAQAAR